MSYAGGFFSTLAVGASGKKVLEAGTVPLNKIAWDVFQDAAAPGVNLMDLANDGDTVIAVSTVGTVYRVGIGGKDFTGPLAMPKALNMTAAIGKPTRFVASGVQDAGNNNVMLSDTHGQTWGQFAAPVPAGMIAQSAGYNPRTGTFIIAGNNRMMRSADGINWSDITPALFGAVDYYGLIWFDYGPFPGRWITGPGTIGISANIATSDDDGTTWVQRGPTWGNNAKYAFAASKIYGRLGCAAATSFGVSADGGATFTGIGAAIADTYDVCAMPSGRFIFGGANRGDGKPRLEITDSDGTNIRVIDAPINCVINACRYYGSRFYVAATGGGSPLIFSTASRFF